MLRITKVQKISTLGKHVKVQYFKICLRKRLAIKTIQFYIHDRSNSDLARYKIPTYICYNMEHKKLNSFHRKF